MKVLVKNYNGTSKIWLDLPGIPQKGEILEFSILKGMDGLSIKEKKLAEESSEFLKAAVEVRGSTENVKAQRREFKSEKALLA